MASALHFGPAHVPSQESPEAAIEALVDRGYTACEIDFAQRFWMDYDFAARFGALAREHDIVLSVLPLVTPPRSNTRAPLRRPHKIKSHNRA